jgi:hypothetical protein
MPASVSASEASIRFRLATSRVTGAALRARSRKRASWALSVGKLARSILMSSSVTARASLSVSVLALSHSTPYSCRATAARLLRDRLARGVRRRHRHHRHPSPRAR